MFQPQREFPDFNAREVEIARTRVECGAVFFNHHFPGWQSRIRDAGSLLHMESSHYCAAAISAKGRTGPNGKCLMVHGDVCEAYKEFNSVEMGCSGGGRISWKLLELMWKEAAQYYPPLAPSA